MRKSRLALFAAVVLVLVAISAPAAQQSDNSRRKSPKQTQDRGVDDVDVTTPVAQRIGQRELAGVQITERPDGTLVARLDESFHDAVVATKNADGTISYTCLHGLPAAEGLAKAHAAAPAKPTTARLEEK
jgi:hypothetical protein